MIKKLIVLGFLVLSFSIHAFSTPESPELIDNLVSLKKGKTSTAFRGLERSFYQEKSIDKKAEMASILAFSPENILKRGRYLYGRFALENHPSLSHETRIRLFRLVGDLYFDQANLIEAAWAYKEALKIKEAKFSFREYFTYKLGWVLLNEKKPREAFSLWLNWLEIHQKKGDLTENIIRDLGRAWGEAFYLKHEADLSSAESLALNAEEKKVFFSGIESSVHREKKIRLNALLTVFSESSFGTDFFKHSLLRSRLFKKHPCLSVDWVLKFKISSELNESISHLLASCAYRLDHRKNKNQSKNLQTALAKAYVGVPLKGIKRWPKAHSLLQAGKLKLSCVEFVAMSNEFVIEGEQSKKPIKELLSSLQGVNRVCSKHEPEARKNLILKLLSSKEVAAQVSSKGYEWLSVLSSLLKNTLSPDRAGKLIVEYANTWKNTKLPELVLEVLKPSSEIQAKLIQAFAHQPIQPPYRKNFDQIVKNKIISAEYLKAKSWLNDFLPLKTVNSFDSMRLWVLLAISNPEENKIQKIALQYLDLLKKERHIKYTNRKTAAYLLMQARDWDSIWLNWKLLSPVYQVETDLGLAALNDSLVNGGKRNKIWANLGNDRFVKYVQILNEWTRGKKISFNKSKIILKAPKAIKKSKIHKDALTLRKIKNVESRYENIRFKPGPRLASHLQKKMNALRRSFLRAKEHVWSSDPLFYSASRSLEKSRKSLAQAIRSIPVSEKDVQTQLKQLADVVQSWKFKVGS